MSFNIFELSIFKGRPVELFRFVYGANRFLYTSSDADIAYQGESYKATPITRSRIGIAHDLTRADITVKVPRDNKLVGLYIGPPPDDVVSLTIYGFHKGDTEFVVLWQGRITGVNFADSEANITCEPVFTSLRRPGLRTMYQGLCPHELYGPACRAQSESYKVVTQSVAYNGVNMTVAASAMATNWAMGGLLTTQGGAKRWILGQTGGVLKLNNIIPGHVVGEQVTIYAGCDRLLDTCWNKFGNGLNYGGFPYIPNKNPFLGDPIV